jgi:hypothetical protein
MDELMRELNQFSDMTNTFTMLDVGVMFGLSFLLTLILGMVYRWTHRGVSYSQSFVHTLVIMGITVAFIMLIIGSNLARAFTLVGALSIIRFRSAVKETRDLGFVFMAMAIGMACGTRFYLLAIFATLSLSCVVMIMSKLNLFAKIIRERILIVRLPADQDFYETFRELFRKTLDQYSIISVETVRNETLQEIVASVELARSTDPTAFLESIRKLNSNNKVSLILGQQEIDL